MLSLILSLVACTTDPTPPAHELEADASDAVAAPSDAVIRLTPHGAEAEVELPDSNLPPGRTTGVTPLRGEPELVRTLDGVDVYALDLPFTPELMRDGRSALDDGAHVADGVVLSGDGGRLPFSVEDRQGTWGWTSTHILIRQREGKPPPRAASFKLRAPGLGRAEESLTFSSAGMDPVAFAFRPMGTQARSFDGIYLPAPGSVTWTLGVGPEDVFEADVVILESPVRSSGSDGAYVIVEVEQGAEVIELARVEVGKEMVHIRAPLDRVAGERVRLRLRSDPGATRFYDHVYVVDPVVHTPAIAPRHVVLVVLDSVGAGALGLYGQELPVSPSLDAFGASGVVVEGARTVSATASRALSSVLTGRLWPWRERAVPLQEALLQAGYATAAVFTRWELAEDPWFRRGWVQRRAAEGLDAADVVQEGLAFLSHHADRDAMVLLHFSDALPPWHEPPSARGRFVKEPRRPVDVSPGALALVGPGDRSVQTYARGRYHQAVRHMDDALGRLFEALPGGSVVLVVGTHGEALWQHGRFGHDDGFRDEVLSVPLLARIPFAEPGRRQGNVSLLDVAPTVYEAVGLPVPDSDGRPLVALFGGEEGAVTAMAQRYLPFGGPPAEPAGWGVVQGDVTWFGRGGREILVDRRQDPAQSVSTPGLDPVPYRAAFAALVGGAVRPTWTVTPPDDPRSGAVDVRLQHPDGFAAAWVTTLEGGTLEVPFGPDGVAVEAARLGGSYRSVTVVPARHAVAPAGLRIERLGGESPQVWDVPATAAPADVGLAPVVVEAGGATVRVTGDWWVDVSAR